MSLKIIELNDSEVRVYGESGVIAGSPGFALAGKRGLQLGAEAEQQARLHPTQSFNKFWQQLSMEPLGRSFAGIRHSADLAYAHLLHVADLAELEGEVLFAVPGNFTAPQLSILLGLAKQCPFDTVGLIDSALASVINLARDESVIYIDQQLHQVLISRFVVRDSALQRESVIQVPGVGSQNFIDLMMQLATSLFIQQSRFNPQHNAASEQQLYNALPGWLAQANDKSTSVLMELKAGTSVHQAKLPGENLARKLDVYFQRIAQQVRVLASDDGSQILVSQRLGELPGFVENFSAYGNVELVGPQELGKACITYREQIIDSAGDIRFVSSLPFAHASVRAGAQVTGTDGRRPDPTHILFEDWALSVERLEINNRQSVNGSPASAGALNLSVNGLPDYLGQIERRSDGVYLLCGEAGAFLNNEKIAGRHRLFQGDRLRFGERSRELNLIREVHGRS